jgi:NAD(P)-dependent dehydrogenase (short-subunit alcohol dehydrogenase family)
MKTVVITGCGSGFGFGLAHACLKAGHHVVATNPDTEGLLERIAAGLSADARARLEVAVLDVRDPAATQTLAERLGETVDVLVNNAGYAVFATQEEADLEQIRDLFDVNVLGPARTTQAFLPSLRARRGVIVQLSSVAGRMTFPESGFYAATKHAVEAMSHALLCEAGPMGVRVRLIQPGAFATSFYETAETYAPPLKDTSVYAEASETWSAWREDVLEAPQDPQLVIHAILKSMEDPTPYQRIPVGADAARILGLIEAIGEDAWTAWSLQQSGYTQQIAQAGILSPEDALSTTDLQALKATLAALRLGHLTSWERTENGREALAHLKKISVL